MVPLAHKQYKPWSRLAKRHEKSSVSATLSLSHPLGDGLVRGSASLLLSSRRRNEEYLIKTSFFELKTTLLKLWRFYVKYRVLKRYFL